MCVSIDWADIAFHYLLDSQGYVYEGRDARAVPSAVRGYLISVCVVL